MANQNHTLDQRLRGVQTRTRVINEAASQQVVHPTTNEVRWPRLVAFFGETVLFAAMGLVRDVFDKMGDSEEKGNGTIRELNNCFFLVLFEIMFSMESGAYQKIFEFMVDSGSPKTKIKQSTFSVFLVWDKSG